MNVKVSFQINLIFLNDILLKLIIKRSSSKYTDNTTHLYCFYHYQIKHSQNNSPSIKQLAKHLSREYSNLKIIDYKLMISVIVLILTVYLSSSSQVSANLVLTQYDPLIFSLTFSQPVPRPQFQLLFNNLYNMPYTFITKNQISQTFIFQSSLQGVSQNSNIQIPLSIADGKLDISSYILTAEKNAIHINYLSLFGILLVTAGYCFSVSTVLGRLIIQFIQLYILFMFQTNITTTLITDLYTGLLLIPPTQTLITQFANYQQYLVLCMALPISIFFFFASIGYLNKKINNGEKSILSRILYKELTFNIFLKIANIFTFNLLFNSIMFVNLTKSQQVILSQNIKTIGQILVYFNIITYIYFIYLKIYILNPKLGESAESREKYSHGNQFKSFKVFHQKLQLNVWYKRNLEVFLSLKMTLLIFIFFWTDIFQYFALLIEFLHIFYIFTFRPFHDEFYLNTKVVCRLLFFIEYIIIVLGNLYYFLGSSSLNYQSIRKYALARDTLFLLFELAIFCIVFFEIYFKCSNLNYQIKLVRQANQFKFELVEKTKTLTEYNDKRHKLTVYSDKSRANARKTSFSQIQSSSQTKNQKEMQSPTLKPYSQNRGARSKSRSKMQYQLLEMMELSRMSESQKKTQKPQPQLKKEVKNNDKKKLKWNQESLLASFVNKK